MNINTNMEDLVSESNAEPDGLIRVTHTIKDHSGQRIKSTHSVSELIQELPHLDEPVFKALPWRWDNYDQWARSCTSASLGEGQGRNSCVKISLLSGLPSKPIPISNKCWAIFQAIKADNELTKHARGDNSNQLRYLLPPAALCCSLSKSCEDFNNPDQIGNVKNINSAKISSAKRQPRRTTDKCLPFILKTPDASFDAQDVSKNQDLTCATNVVSKDKLEKGQTCLSPTNPQDAVADNVASKSLRKKHDNNNTSKRIHVISKRNISTRPKTTEPSRRTIPPTCSEPMLLSKPRAQYTVTKRSVSVGEIKKNNDCIPPLSSSTSSASIVSLCAPSSIDDHSVENHTSSSDDKEETRSMLGLRVERAMTAPVISLDRCSSSMTSRTSMVDDSSPSDHSDNLEKLEIIGQPASSIGDEEDGTHSVSTSANEGEDKVTPQVDLITSDSDVTDREPRSSCSTSRASGESPHLSLRNATNDNRLNIRKGSGDPRRTFPGSKSSVVEGGKLVTCNSSDSNNMILEVQDQKQTKCKKEKENVPIRYAANDKKNPESITSDHYLGKSLNERRDTPKRGRPTTRELSEPPRQHLFRYPGVVTLQITRDHARTCSMLRQRPSTIESVTSRPSRVRLPPSFPAPSALKTIAACKTNSLTTSAEPQLSPVNVSSVQFFDFQDLRSSFGRKSLTDLNSFRPDHSSRR